MFQRLNIFLNLFRLLNLISLLNLIGLLSRISLLKLLASFGGTLVLRTNFSNFLYTFQPFISFVMLIDLAHRRQEFRWQHEAAISHIFWSAAKVSVSTELKKF